MELFGLSNPITPLTPSQVIIEEGQAQSEGYFLRVLIGFDIFMNVIFGGNPDETISSRASRAATEGKLWGILMSKFLNIFQRDPGADAQSGDLQRADDVVKLEEQSGNV